MAYCRLQHMFSYNWCTISIDGVLLWHSHVVSISCFICVALNEIGKNAMEWYFIATVVIGHDRVHVVCELLSKHKPETCRLQ